MRIRLIPHLLSLFVPIVTAHLSLDMLLAGGHFYLLQARLCWRDAELGAETELSKF